MSEEASTRMPFWKECLRLLYWVFFKPVELIEYAGTLETSVKRVHSDHYILRLRRNKALLRLLKQAILVIFVSIGVLLFLALPNIIKITKETIDWDRLLWGILIGLLVSLAFSFFCGFLMSSVNTWKGAGAFIGCLTLGSINFGTAFGLFFGFYSLNLELIIKLLQGDINWLRYVESNWAASGGIYGYLIILIPVSIFSSIIVGAYALVTNKNSNRNILFIGIGIIIILGTSDGILSVGILQGINAAITHGIVLLILIGMLFARLVLFIPQLFWVSLSRIVIRYKRSQLEQLIRCIPPHYDQIIWLPLWGLNDLLRILARDNLHQILPEVSLLYDSLAQKGQANLAKANITADVLAGYISIEQLAKSPQQIDWLPDDLKQVRPDLAEILPGLFAISRELDYALESGSPLSRRLALREAMDQLDGLQKKLSFLGREGKERWSPVLAQWHTVMQSGLEQAASFSQSAGGVENPYQAGTPLPLSRRTLFKGRQALASELSNALRERGRPTLILHGPRRMGKTSFLLQLPALLPGRTVPVFISLQDPAVTSSDSAFLYAIAHAITRDAQPQRLILPAPERARFEERPFEALDEWLGRAWKALQDFSLLLAFDEFEKAGEAFDSGQLSRHILNQLRTLIEHQHRMALLFAGVQKLDELGPDYSSYFINARSLSMGYLEPPEAEELIRNPDPQVPFELSYDDEVVKRILDETLGHPYLVQLVCSCLVECANRHQTLHAGETLLEEAEELAFERGANYFNNIWLEMAGEEGQKLLRQVAAAPEALKLEPQDTAQRKALSRMLRLKVLHKSEAGYTVEVPLVARWVNEYAMD